MSIAAFVGTGLAVGVGASAAGASTALAVGAGALAGGAAAYGASQTKKGQKANRSNLMAHNEAVIKNEKELRKLFDGFIGKYNESAEKLEEGLTIQEYVERAAYALGDPTLIAKYRESRNADWQQMQQWADQANEQNASAFKKMLDSVSGGDFGEFLKIRNKTIVSNDLQDVYNEAQRIRSAKQPAGSVVRGPEGEAVAGQRQDKANFLTSVTAKLGYDETQFNRSRTAIEDDRAAATRHTQHASEFGQFINFADFAAQNVVQPFNQQSLEAQLRKLQIESGLASQAMGAAFGAPQPPPTIDTSASQALTAEATRSAIAGLASLYKSPSTTTSPATSRSASLSTLEGREQSPFLKPTAYG
jgi:hypothetical protein